MEVSKGLINPEETPKIPHQPAQKLSPGPFTFTYYAEEKNTPSTQGEAEQEGPIRMLDFQSETELWRFMTSIVPSEHQEMMHLQEGAWCQNKHGDNTEMPTTRNENHKKEADARQYKQESYP